MKNIILRILLLLTAAAFTSCGHKSVDFNFKGKSILFTESNISGEKLVHLNYSNQTRLNIDEIDPLKYGEFKISSNNGEVAAFAFDELENVITMFDLRRNIVRTSDLNQIFDKKPITRVHYISADHDSVIALSGLSSYLYIYSQKSLKLLRKIDIMDYGFTTSLIVGINLGSQHTVSGMCEYHEGQKASGYFSTLFVYDYDSNIFHSMNLPHYNTSNWSPDGKKLVVFDSARSPAILHYPEMKVENLGKIVPDSLTITGDPFFIANELLVFTAAKSTEMWNIFMSNQIYVYSLNEKRIIKQLTTNESQKKIHDVRY